MNAQEKFVEPTEEEVRRHALETYLDLGRPSKAPYPIGSYARLWWLSEQQKEWSLRHGF